MARLKDLTLRCMPCGRMGRDPDLFGACICGANNWEETAPQPVAPPRPAPPHHGPPQLRLVPGLPHAPAAATPPRQPPRGDGFVDGSRVPPIIVDDIQGARINELLGGIKRGALVLIVGAAGAGKSTATAELAGKTAEHWARPEAGPLRVPNCPVYWLDADQRDPALVRECWINGGVDHVFRQPDRVRRLDERPQPYRFEEALALVPPTARVVVFDSLETWAPNDPKRLGVLIALRAHPAWLKVMIGGANNRGTVSGVGALERADDVTVYAERTEDGRHELRFTKRRWKPCASARARGAGKITPGPTPTSPVAPPTDAPIPAAPAPDFSRELIGLAAGWGVREIEGYKATLRAQQVPQDSIEGWVAAVREARGELEGDGEAPPDLPPTIH
jgi:AAA domain